MHFLKFLQNQFPFSITFTPKTAKENTPDTDRNVSEFEKMNRVGEGTYGVVYRARDTKTGEIVALKRVRMDREKDGMPVSGLREVHVLLKCEHDNVVREVFNKQQSHFHLDLHSNVAIFRN